jgi:hypothetical protein
VAVTDEVQSVVAQVADVQIDEVASPRLMALIPGVFGKTSAVRIYLVDVKGGRCALVFHEGTVGEHVDIYPNSAMAVNRYCDAISLLAWFVAVGETHGLWPMEKRLGSVKPEGLGDAADV